MKEKKTSIKINTKYPCMHVLLDTENHPFPHSDFVTFPVQIVNENNQKEYPAIFLYDIPLPPRD